MHKIPLCIPFIDENEIKAVQEVLQSGWYAHGPQNEQFEDKFAAYIGTKYALTLNSCASALQLAIQALGITGEVILPSFTFVASANAIIRAGAKPVFVDVKYDTCNIDPVAIESAITSRTEAIMPVHFGGQSCDMNAIMVIAEKHNLAVIEDSAETIGGLYNGRKTGSFGIGCFSFFPTKNMTTGEGGMLTTSDELIARKVKILSAHGIEKNKDEQFVNKPWIRDAIYPGYNFRMSNILAAIGLQQISKVDTMNSLRRKHANYLNAQLSDFQLIDLPKENEGCKHVYQMFTIKIKNQLRNKFYFELQKRGIGVSVHFDPPVHQQRYFKQYSSGGNNDLHITEQLANSILTLPMYPQLNKDELDSIIGALSIISDSESKIMI